MLRSKIFIKKTKRGGIRKIVREHYLRDDLYCGLKNCQTCADRHCKLLNDQPLFAEDDDIMEINERKQDLEKDAKLTVKHLVDFNGKEECHILIPDTNIVVHQIDVLEDPSFKNVVILSTVLDEVKHQSLTVYKRLHDLLDNPEKQFVVFVNEHHCETYVERERGESANDRNDRAIRVASQWFSRHLLLLPGVSSDLKVVLLTNDVDNRNKARLLKKENKLSNLLIMSANKYVDKLKDRDDLKEKLGASESNLFGHDKFEYPAHLSPTEVKVGLAAGRLHKAKFEASRYNYLEAEVRVNGIDAAVLIQGREHLNRAVHDDIVAVEILPEAEWSAPSDLVLDDKTSAADEQNADRLQEKGDSSAKRPSGRVVGIITRNWRQYCGMIQHSLLPESNRHLFVAAERRIPKIRIETRQYEMLQNKRIVVTIDSWPRNSRYPLGHFVRTLGEIGDKATENEVLLLEHDIPHTAFSQRVLNCLPDENWLISDEELAKREDLRSLHVCSVDPPGCTDIDDALHLRTLPNGNYEVGVHIADVTHFVRPGTALDLEASNRSTTVYLTDRRIDMVPELLSSNLCSLRSKVDRCAFSVLWEITPINDKDPKEGCRIVSTRFCKSVIHSKASLTYGEAQTRIDDASLSDPVTLGLRQLNSLAKVLKERRQELGALTLASAEIRFEVDSETHDPIQVTEKQIRDTNSMVEEFMLLANGSVAERIHQEFPQCAVLRRHPSPPYSNFDPLVSVCKSYGLNMDVRSNKALATSLDQAVVPSNPFFNTMLRMLTTRCMMQAKYFASGTMPVRDFYHYGLAMDHYTHFTSPIRRYADILVHRLLAVSIGADSSYPELMDKNKTQSVLQNVNYRHLMAQYASRASVGLHTILFFKARVLDEPAYILNIKKNALQVFVPRFGLEGTIHVDKLSPLHDEVACTQTVSGHTFHIFDPVTVRVSINDSNIQHQKINMQLVKPQVAGLSVEPEPIETDPIVSNKATKSPRKKMKKMSETPLVD